MTCNKTYRVDISHENGKECATVSVDGVQVDSFEGKNAVERAVKKVEQLQEEEGRDVISFEF